MIENLKEGSRGNLTSVTNIVQVIFLVIFVLSISFGFLVNLSSYITKKRTILSRTPYSLLKFKMKRVQSVTPRELDLSIGAAASRLRLSTIRISMII